MVVIGKFKLGSKTYAILDNNGKYLVGRLNKGKVSFKFNNEEKILIKEVIKRIIPVNDGVKLVPVTVNGNKYDIRFDRSTNVFMFSPEPNTNDLSILNNIFNNQHLEVYLGFIDKNNAYIKRFIKLGKKTLLVLLSSSILLSTTSCMKNDIEEQLDNDIDIEYEEVLDNIEDDKLINIIEEEPNIEIEVIDELDQDYLEEVQNSLDNNVKEEKVEEVQENFDNNIKEDVELEEIGDKEDNFDFSKIEEAINSNPNLSEEEKNVVLSCPEIFEDGYGYYNNDNLMEKLKSFQIKYINEINGTTGGTYNLYDNVIKIYKTDRFSYEYNSVLTHEFCHLIQDTNTPDFIDFSWSAFLLEGVNVITNNEYYGNGSKSYDNAYPFNVKCVKSLCEILGSDVIKEYNYYLNADKIIESLTLLDNNYEKAATLIDYLNTYWSLYLGNDSIEYDIKDIEDIITNELSYYYEIKFNRSVDDDLIMLYYLDSALFREKAGETFEISDEYSDVVNEISSKGVINPRLMNEPYVFEVEKDPVLIGYDGIPLNEAIENGLVLEDGSTFFADCYIDYENNMFMRAMYSYDDTKITFEINESNRYLNNDLSR